MLFPPMQFPENHFNPRSPCGERQMYIDKLQGNILISIHAPRVGSDFACLLSPPSAYNFNPRSPCGERLAVVDGLIGGNQFQSTLPVGGATGACNLRRMGIPYFNPRSPCGERLPVAIDAGRTFAISIHAPRVGSDVWLGFLPGGRIFLFQSTLPVWGATGVSRGKDPVHRISIHAPRVGSDKGRRACGHDIGISIHAPRVGSDGRQLPHHHPGHRISIHAPRVGSDLLKRA